MIGALGVDIRTLYTIVFALGALAGLAGAMVGALQSVQVGMGVLALILPSSSSSLAASIDQGAGWR